MAKINGLGVRLYAAGYDLNTDVSAIQAIGHTQAMLEVPNLDKSAMERLGGLLDGRLTVNGWLDPASAHAVWTANSGKLPTADQIVICGFGTALGDAFAGMVAKQAAYGVSRQPGGAIATTAEYASDDGNGLEYGVLLTTGPKQTDAAAANSTSVDNAAASTNGGAGYLQIISLGSGTPTVKIQKSSDNSSWSDMVTFTVNSAHTAERIAVAGTVPRYTRVISSGTFTNLVFVAGFARL